MRHPERPYAAAVRGAGRRLAGADLRLLLLALLDEKPSHGYEFIKALEERSGGFYVPSPGVIYPALTHFAAIGHAALEANGPRKRYSLTVAGRQFLDAQRARADALFAQFSRSRERMERVRRALGMADDSTAEDCAVGGTPQLRGARRELQLALQGKWRSGREEQRRIADILNRATEEIQGKRQRGA